MRENHSWLKEDKSIFLILVRKVVSSELALGSTLFGLFFLALLY